MEAFSLLLCRPKAQSECCQCLWHKASLALSQRPKRLRAITVHRHPSGKRQSRLCNILVQAPHRQPSPDSAMSDQPLFPGISPITGALLSMLHPLPAHCQAGGGARRRPGEPHHLWAGAAHPWIRAGAEGVAGPYRCCLCRHAVPVLPEQQ